MKKIFLQTLTLCALLFALCASTQDTQAQTIAFNDTCGNAVNKTFYTNFTVTEIDSIVFTLFCKGEIDLDSLDVKFGYSMPGYFTHTNTTNKAYSKTLTVNLDTAVTAYDSVGVTIPVSALKGFNFIQWQLQPASSGNDTGDPGQKATVIITKYP